MLPSFTSHIIASITLAIPAMILAETSLSFLGLGLQPPTISWGVLLREAQNIRSIATAPWLFAPGVAVVLAVHRAQLPRRRPARRSRSVQQVSDAATRPPSGRRRSRPTRSPVVLEVRDLATHFPVRNGVVKAVDGVSFTLAARPDALHRRRKRLGQERHRALDPADRRCARPHRLRLDDPAPRQTARTVDLARLDPRGRAIRAVRGGEIAMIFQEPMSSLSPVHTVGDQIMEVLRLHLRHEQEGRRARAPIELLPQVEIPKPEARDRPLHVRVLRRHAPARDDRDGARLQSVAADRRRADDRARRHDAGRDPRPDQAAAGSSTAWR